MANRRASHAAARERDQVTPGQLVQLHQQIKQGQISRGLMQWFLVTHGDSLAEFPGSMSPSRLNTWLVDRLAGQGVYDNTSAIEPAERLVPLMQHFTNPQGYRLTAPVEDLHDLAPVAVFWRRVNDVRPVGPSALLNAARGNNPGLDARLTVARLNEVGKSLSRPFASDRRWDVVFNVVGKLPIHDRLIDMANAFDDLWVSPPELEYEDWYWPAWIYPGAATSLSSVISSAALALLDNREHLSKLFHPYLTLVLRGNIPYGFDQDNNLIVLCADQVE